MSKLNNTIFLAAMMLMLTLAAASCSRETGDYGAPPSLRGGEARETLSPALFTGATADAYRIAREIPEVLDSLHCYCECKKNFGHKSLLTCYVDEHAKHCDVCQDEAFMAYELHRQGADIKSIRAAVDQRFSNRSH
ncbi:MAG: hypothetical protein HZB83_07495 [Deltaproteobacteria bacterium]|nr:hypothetical protein [Deltaproteobacteria bacterium]